MKIIQPSFSIIDQDFGIDGIFRQIELAGRTCYRSEDRITETSAKVFVERMIASGHTAMLEHGTVYLAMPMETILSIEANGWGKYVKNPYSKGYKVCEVGGERRVAVTTNYRVLVENRWLDDLRYICAPTIYHAKRITVLFHTQVAISREFNRHRVNSIAESSTRYCNYSKDKFGNEITVNLPSWIEPAAITPEAMDKAVMQNKLLELANTWGNAQVKFPKEFTALDYWLLANTMAEYCYMGLIQQGWTAQQARTILPLDTNTDLVHTAFVEDWQHFFDLRALGTTGKPHPDASCLAIPLYNEFKKRGLL